MAWRHYSLLLFLCLPPLPAPAQVTVYRSVDADGTVSFSDQPPPDRPSQALHLDVPAPREAGLLVERLEAMRETTDRMARDRREREAARAELAAARRPAPAPQPPAATVGRDPVFLPVYLRPWWQRPGLHPRPPLRGNFDVIEPGNHQLMRPIVSSRRGSPPPRDR